MKTKTDKFYIVRTYSAGVWFGNIQKLDGTIAIVTNARRIYYWAGAATLSQLAVEGTKRPSDCKFTLTITDEEGVYLPQVIEVLPCTNEAVTNIKNLDKGIWINVSYFKYLWLKINRYIVRKIK